MTRYDTASAPSGCRTLVPNWLERTLFVLLMSGPPKFRVRDPIASLESTIDSVVVLHIVVWGAAALWVFARVYPSVLRRGKIPSVNAAQAIGGLFIAALSLSMWRSPGVLLTAFTLGQFCVMLGFFWMFTYRFGAMATLRHIFFGVSLLVVVTAVALFVAPDLVISVVEDDIRLRGDYLAETSLVAIIGLVFCLSSLPALTGPIFWGALSSFGGLLIVSRVRSAYVAFAAFLVFGFVYGKGLRVRKLIAPLAVVMFSVFLLDAITSTTDYLIREEESVQTMSDRIPLWQHLTNEVMQRAPITGLGFYAATRVVATDYNPGLGNAHSAFFETLVGGGILGAGMYVLLWISLLWFAVRVLQVAGGQPAAVATVGLLCVTFLLGLTTSAAVLAGPLGFTFWSLTAVLPALWREGARARAIENHRLPHRAASQKKPVAGAAYGFARENS